MNHHLLWNDELTKVVFPLLRRCLYLQCTNCTTYVCRLTVSIPESQLLHWRGSSTDSSDCWGRVQDSQETGSYHVAQSSFRCRELEQKYKLCVSLQSVNKTTTFSETSAISGLTLGIRNLRDGALFKGHALTLWPWLIRDVRFTNVAGSCARKTFKHQWCLKNNSKINKQPVKWG